MDSTAIMTTMPPLSRSVLANFVMPQRRDRGAIAAMGRRRPPWSGCIFLPCFCLANRMSEVCQPKNQQIPNHWPTRHLHQYLAEWDVWSTILCISIGWRCLCRMVRQIRHLGVVGARWSSGRHGWIVFCVHLSYFNLDYLSHLIFILIPLWRGFYFSEEMLSDVHTEDVAFWRTKCFLRALRRVACTHSYVGSLNGQYTYSSTIWWI